MTFSIRKLFYLIGLVAIAFALSQSEHSGDRSSVVSSLDFSPAGDQLLISVHEFNGPDIKRQTEFDRSIQLFDYPEMRLLQTVAQDKQRRQKIDGSTVREPLTGFRYSQQDADIFFWRSQIKAIHDGKHAFYLSKDCNQLICRNLATGEKTVTTIVETGTLYDFCVADEGKQILFQVQTVWRDYSRSRDGTVVSVGEDEYFVSDESDDPEVKARSIVLVEPDLDCSMVYHDVLGVDAAEPVVLPFDPTLPDDRELKSVDGEEGEENQIFRLANDNDIFSSVTPNEFAMLQSHPIKYRLAFLDSPPKESARVAVVATNELLDLSSDTQAQAAARPDDMPRWFSSIVEHDTSSGDCLCARLLRNQKVFLSVATDAVPNKSTINVTFRSEGDAESRLSLSPNGRDLALSNRKRVFVYQVDNLLSESTPEELIQADLVGGLLVNPNEVARIATDNRATSLEFTPNGDSLMIGDDRGCISIFDCRSGQRTSSLEIPGKPRGLERQLVLALLFFWLSIGVASVFFSRSNSLP